MLGIGLARAILNFVAEPIKIVMQKICRIRERAVAVIFLNIAENFNNRLVLSALVRELVSVVKKLHKEKSHSCLVDISLTPGVVYKCPNEVFNQILNGENVCNLEVQVSLILSIKKGTDEKVFNGCFLSSEHFKSFVEKCGLNDKVYRNIVFACGQNLLRCILTEQKKLTLVQGYLFSVNDVHSLPRAHIYRLNIIVCVARKVDKSRVLSDAYEFSVNKELF